MAAPATKKKSTARLASAPKAPAGSFENPLIPNARLQQIYMALLHSRMLEARLVPAAQRAPEALGAGMILNLRKEDTLLSASPSHRLLKGAPLKALLAKQAPRSIDAGFPAVNVLPTIADSAAALYAATGIAFANQAAAGASHDSHVVLAYTADAAACLAAARLAELHRLPILFILTQNAKSAAVSLRARRFGIPGIPVDRDDAVAVYRVAQEGIARARANGGPTIVEAMRFTGPSTHRPDAVATMERFLKSKGLWTAAWKRSLLAGFSRDLATAARRNR